MSALFDALSAARAALCDARGDVRYLEVLDRFISQHAPSSYVFTIEMLDEPGDYLVNDVPWSPEPVHQDAALSIFLLLERAGSFLDLCQIQEPCRRRSEFLRRKLIRAAGSCDAPALVDDLRRFLRVRKHGTKVLATFKGRGRWRVARQPPSVRQVCKLGDSAGEGENHLQERRTNENECPQH